MPKPTLDPFVSAHGLLRADKRVLSALLEGDRLDADELAARAEIGRSTAARSARRLSEIGAISQTRAASGPGRPRLIFTLARERACAAGFFWDDRKLHGALTGLDGELWRRRAITLQEDSARRSAAPEDVCRAISQCIADWRRARAPIDSLVSASLCMPGEKAGGVPVDGEASGFAARVHELLDKYGMPVEQLSRPAVAAGAVAWTRPDIVEDRMIAIWIGSEVEAERGLKPGARFGRRIGRRAGGDVPPGIARLTDAMGHPEQLTEERMLKEIAHWQGRLDDWIARAAIHAGDQPAERVVVALGAPNMGLDCDLKLEPWYDVFKPGAAAPEWFEISVTDDALAQTVAWAGLFRLLRRGAPDWSG